MELIEVAEPALIFSPEDTISKVTAEMYRKKRHEALVFKGQEYLGMFTARDLVKRSINDPDKVRLGNLKAILKKVTPFSPNSSLREIADAMITNGYRSVPIKSGKGFMTVTKFGLLKLLPADFLKGKSASDVLVFPHCVSTDDSLAVARSILRQMHGSRLAIINELGRAEGIVDTLDLLRAIIDKTKASRGELVGEKINLRGISISSHTLSQTIPLRTTPDASLREVVQKMIKANETTVVVEDERFRGLVTPAGILKLLSPEVSGVYVRITGQEKEDVFIRSVIDEEIRGEIRKLSRFLPIDYMTLHIDRHRDTGRRIKYSIHAKIVSQKGMFFAKAAAWDLTKAMHELLDRFEREIKKAKGKAKALARGRPVRSQLKI